MCSHVTKDHFHLPTELKEQNSNTKLNPSTHKVIILEI